MLFASSSCWIDRVESSKTPLAVRYRLPLLAPVVLLKCRLIEEGEDDQHCEYQNIEHQLAY
jgi:hypothetical protein